MPEHVIPSLVSRDKSSTERSCIDCPAFEILGEGSARCKAKSIPLTLRSWDSTTRDLALTRQGTNCEIYGTDTTAESISIEQWNELKRPPVIFPVGRKNERPMVARLMVSNPNCRDCKHFIPESMARALIPINEGSFIGLCGAKGIALPKGSEKQIAEECKYLEHGTFPLEGIHAIHMGPDYNPAYLQKRAGVSLNHLPGGFDPLIYPTEIELDQGMIDSGIRAWVGIKDPKSANKVFVPIFNPAFFESEEQVKIPSTDDETMPANYVDHAGIVYKVLVSWIELDETPALIGEAGNGKTELFRHIAWIMQLPFERITITASSEVDDLAGKFLFVDGQTEFQYGRLAKAWGKPNIICLDEPNTGPNDVLQFIRPLIDNSKQLVLDQNKGELISRDQFCFLGIAMNPAFDYKNIGANPMADADNSRLLHLEVPLPSEVVEREIIRQRLLIKDQWEIPDAILDSIMAIARTLREMSKDDEVPFSWGIRVQLKVARLLKWFDFHDAYMMAMGGSVDPDTQDKVISVVKASTPKRG